MSGTKCRVNSEASNASNMYQAQVGGNMEKRGWKEMGESLEGKKWVKEGG